MGLYTVSQAPLAAIPGVHNGTGPQHDPGHAIVVPDSVPGAGLLQFSGADVAITTMLFTIDANVVPNWFGVAVPDGLADFTQANLFFHPTPGQAGYSDTDYPTKAGPWPKLFYYMERLGYQLAAAGRGQVVVMPFLTGGALGDWILPANWQDLLTQILTQASAALQPAAPAPGPLAPIVVSSFSSGILYSHAFRSSAAGMPAGLGEIWDFDGSLSTLSEYSAELRRGQSVPVVQYDQNAALGASSYHVPSSRWADFYDPAAVPKTALAVHPLIRDFMFMHAATVSSVGAEITATAPPSPVPGDPAPAEPPAPPQNTPAAPSIGIPIPPSIRTVPTPAPPSISPAAPFQPPPDLPLPATPSAPGMVPQIALPGPVPAFPPTLVSPAPPASAATSGYCATALVGIVATTSVQAITAITAIASRGK